MQNIKLKTCTGKHRGNPNLGNTKNFRHDTKSMSCKRKNKVDFIKILKFSSEKKCTQENGTSASDCEKISLHHVFNK